MLARKPAEASWAWDDVPVKQLRGARLLPSWWNALESEIHTTEAGQLYATEDDLQAEERAAIHRCALLYHKRRVQFRREALRRSCEEESSILTPTFHGRTPSTAFAVQAYLAAQEDVRRLPPPTQRRRIS